MNVRVRFAPSPTGYLHVGSARTALSNWIYARSVGGAFVLRIEDTDADRSRPELIDQILRTLEWLGLDWDEGPIRQSGRVERYDHAVDTLLRAGRAFHDEGAVRFRTPDEGVTGWDDVIRGRVEFDNVNLEDFVIRRSNGAATFLLANAVDDLDMGITHAIRGEDLVNTTPKVLLLMQALEAAAPPVYAHLPLLVNERRQKLSKRRDDVAVEDYRDRGYLPEAMANYLATLGWGAPDGVEVRPMAEIVSLFRLEDMNKASAFFDVKKLTHFNAEHIRALSPEAFAARAEPWLAAAAFPVDRAVFTGAAPLIQERVRTLAEAPGMVDFLFLDHVELDEDSWRKAVAENAAAPALLDAAIEGFAAADWSAEALHAALSEAGLAQGLKLNKAQAPIRVATTGRAVGPPLFESLAMLGRERTLERLRAARARC